MLYVKYSSPVENTNSIIESQPLLSALFNDAPDAIFLLDAKSYAIIDCNNRSLEMFEAETKTSLINLSSFRLYDSEPIEFSRNLLEMNIRNGGEHTQELAFRTLKQNVFWGKLIKRAIKIDDQEFIILRISKAIEYLRAEEALSALLRGTAKVTGAKFFKELSILLCRTFDVKYAFIGKISNNKKTLQIVESCGPFNDSGFNNYALQGTLVENVLKGYTTFYPSGSFGLFPGDTFVVENKIEGFMGTPVFGNSGEVIGLIAFMNDKPIHEIPNSRYILSIFASRTAAEFQRMRSKEILKEQARHLASVNNVKDKLLSVISHDLLNPMHTVMGFTELLRSKVNSYEKDKIIERVEIIDNSIKNIYFLLENLNDWSSIFREKARPHAEYFILGDLIDNYLKLFKYIIDIKALHIELHLNQCSPVYSDKHMFGSIVRNILANAIKFTPKEGTIAIGCNEIDNNVVFTIQDNGIGISQEDIDYYLNLCNDLQDIQLYSNKNGGLGLILSRNFAEKIRGKLSIESTIDEGTMVSLAIPKI
jgi:nitrogen-specific signal transduction histidine kinase